MLLTHYDILHVHSHQTLPFDKLPFAAQLNALCDRMGTHQMQQQITGATSDISLQQVFRNPCVPIHRQYRGYPITANSVKTLCESIVHHIHLDYLKGEYHRTSTSAATIAWEGIERSQKSASKIYDAT